MYPVAISGYNEYFLPVLIIDLPGGNPKLLSYIYFFIYIDQ